MKRWIGVLICLFCLNILNAKTITDYKLTPDDFFLSQTLPPLNHQESEFELNRADFINFSPNVEINSDIAGNQFHPSTVYDAQRQIWHAVWWFRNGNGTVNQIYYSKSTDEGGTWSVNERVDNSPIGAEYPCITLDGQGRPVVAWADYRNGGKDIYVSTLTAGSWSSAVKINYGRTHVAHSPNLIFNSNLNLLVAAWTNGAGLSDIYTSTSADAVIWAFHKRANDNLGYMPMASDPRMTVDQGGNIYLVFTGWGGHASSGRFPDVYFTKSTDGGKTWMSPQVRMNIRTDFYQQDPDIAVDNDGNLYAVWEDNWEYFVMLRICLAKSTDGGLNWTNQNVDDGPLGFSSRMYPRIILNDSRLDVAWGLDDRNGSQDVYFTSSYDSAGHWSANQRINDEQYNFINGKIALVGNQGDIYCIWHEYHGNNDVLYNLILSKGVLQYFPPKSTY